MHLWSFNSPAIAEDLDWLCGVSQRPPGLGGALSCHYALRRLRIKFWYPFTVIFLANPTEIIGHEIDEMPGGGVIFSKLLRILDQSLQSGSRPAVQRYSTFRHCSSPIIVSMVRLRFHSPRACVWILLRPETESIETGWNRGWSIKQNGFFSLPEIFSAVEWHRDANSCNSMSSWRMFASNVAFVGSPCCLRLLHQILASQFSGILSLPAYARGTKALCNLGSWPTAQSGGWLSVKDIGALGCQEPSLL